MWTFGVTVSAGLMHSAHGVEDSQLEPPGPGGQVVVEHGVDSLVAGATARVRYGLARWVLPELSLPVQSVSIAPRFSDAGGQSVKDGQSIHHRKGSVTGLGDLRLVAAFPLLADDTGASVTARVGASIPTGDTEPDPFALGAKGESHQHIFFGSGTVDPVVGVEGAMRTGDLLFTAQAEGSVPLYAGKHDYKQGARASAGLGVHWLLGQWSVGVHPGVYWETASKWGDEAAENSGRLDALASASVGWHPKTGPILSLTVGKPFTMRAAGGQFDAMGQATLSASWQVGGDESAP